MCKRNAWVLFSSSGFLLAASNTYALPAFSRSYGTQCTICHLSLMKPTDFGKGFKGAGPAGVPGTVASV
ncbi:MAG: hypothetical protein WAU58_00455 [Terriglobales bacterium]|jgi:hypothetical protein